MVTTLTDHLSNFLSKNEKAKKKDNNLRYPISNPISQKRRSLGEFLKYRINVERSKSRIYFNYGIIDNIEAKYVNRYYHKLHNNRKEKKFTFMTRSQWRFCNFTTRGPERRTVKMVKSTRKLEGKVIFVSTMEIIFFQSLICNSLFCAHY